MSTAQKDARTPVIVLTGFLGAGKTTLLNRILTAEHGRRIAVVVNEFGEVGIDHHLLLSSEEEILEMSNGCICCTVRGDLLRLLFQLSERRCQLDWILIETTGLADPGPLIQTLLVDQRLRSDFALDSIVTVVDAKHIGSQLAAHHEAEEQIACADTILLNKTDLVAPEELDSAEASIRRINPLARLFRTRQAQIEIPLLFDRRRLDLEAALARLTARAHEPSHRHASDVSTVALVEPGELDGQKLSFYFRSILSELAPVLLRMKGILNLRGDTHQFVFHGVHSVFEGRPGREWAPGEPRLNRLVFIGRRLDAERLARGFKECLLARDGGPPSAPSLSLLEQEVSPFTIEQIRYWVRQILEFPPSAPVIVKEVPCVKPNCPPVETALMVILQGEPPRVFKILKTINEVTFDCVYNLIENPLPCC